MRSWNKPSTRRSDAVGPPEIGVAVATYDFKYITRTKHHKGDAALEIGKPVSLLLAKELPSDQLRPTGFCGKKTKRRAE